MSKKEETTVEGFKGFPIVKQIMALLKLDDAGHISKFFEKEVKRFKTEIKTLENNKAVLKLDFDTAVDALDDKIEDAKEDLQDAKFAVTIEDVKNNAAIDSFRAKYWNNIARKRSRLEQLESDLGRAEKDYSDDIEAIDKEIAEFNTSINMIIK